MSNKTKIANIIEGVKQDIAYTEEQYTGGHIAQEIYEGRIAFKQAQLRYLNREFSKLN